MVFEKLQENKKCWKILIKEKFDKISTFLKIWRKSKKIEK